MKESTLLKISLSCSLIGVFIVLLMSENLELKTTKINSITKKNIDQMVKINGVITSVKDLPGILLLNIDDGSVIKVIVFKEEELNLATGEIVEIEGIVKEYKNELEIEASLIKK
tara:strand:+ start:186 stop:527 length:342 start_codon:yes stop_codon:yes gene_type:complete